MIDSTPHVVPVKPLQIRGAFHTNKMTTSGIWSRIMLEIRENINITLYIIQCVQISFGSRRRKKVKMSNLCGPWPSIPGSS